MPYRFLTTLSFSFLCCFQGLAQQDNPAPPPVSVSVLSSRVPAGEFGTLIFKVTANNVTLPRQIDSEGLDISYSGNQSSVTIINGTQQLEFSYFYRFRSDQPGTYTIPAIEVQIGDQTTQTQSIEVTITERDNTDAVNATRPEFAKLDLTKTEFYVNEIIPFTITTYVRGRNSINEIVRPQLEQESFIFKGFKAVSTDATELGNTLYSYAVLPSTFFALKPGEHRLGPAKLGVRVVESGTGFGLSAFFSRTVVKEMASNAVSTTVKALPSGAPSSFTGGVGVFLLNGVPSATEISVGDPISMEFIVSGVGNLRTMSAPVFTGTADIWKSYAASKTLNDEEDSDGVEPGRVQFSQVIIPEKKVTEIPSFELTYFNPNTKSYITLETEPVPIKVSDDRSENSYNLAQEATGSGIESSNGSAALPLPSFDDVLHIRTNSPRWIAELNSRSPSVIFYGVQIIFSLAFTSVIAIGISRFIKTRQLKLATQEEPTTYKQALKQIPKPGASKREYYHAVSTALTLWQTENPDGPPPVMEVIEKISGRCETYLYSGNFDSDVPVAPEEAGELQSVLRRLQRK